MLISKPTQKQATIKAESHKKAVNQKIEHQCQNVKKLQQLYLHYKTLRTSVCGKII